MPKIIVDIPSGSIHRESVFYTINWQSHTENMDYTYERISCLQSDSCTCPIMVYKTLPDRSVALRFLNALKYKKINYPMIFMSHRKIRFCNITFHLVDGNRRIYCDYKKQYCNGFVFENDELRNSGISFVGVCHLFNLDRKTSVRKYFDIFASFLKGVFNE